MKKEKILKIVIIFVVMLIPIIYSFFYLKSYWDPYGNLNDLSVGVVNLDEGKNGENQGNELVKKLKEKDVVDICEVSLEEGEKAISNGEFYALITIPKDFTKYLNSVKEENKQIAKISYKPNQKENYLASQIINRVVTSTEASLKSTVSEKITETLSSNIKEMPDNLQDISDGAGKIIDGSKLLNNGLDQLNNGASTLDNSYKEFDNGIKRIYSGSKELNSGANKLTDGVETLSVGGQTLERAIDQINSGADTLSSSGAQGISDLAQGVSDLNNGASSLKEGVTSYVAGTDSFVSNVNQYVDKQSSLNSNAMVLLQALSTYSGEDSTTLALAAQARQILATDTQGNNFQKLNAFGNSIKQGGAQLTASDEVLKSGANQLSIGTSTMYSKMGDMQKLTLGISELKNGLSQVKQGTTNLNNGIDSIKAGSSNLANGSKILSDGISNLNLNSTKIQTALDSIKQGTKKAANGGSDLVEGETTFKNAIDDGIEDTKKEIKKLNGISEYAANPVEIEEEDYGEVSSYGIAFTPLFLSIGLWVGGLMCYVVLYYDHRHRFGILDYNADNKLLQNFIYMGLSVLFGIVTGFLLKVGLNFEVTNGLLYYFSCVLISTTFMSVIQFLIKNFGDVGKFFALIILVLQLAASGGTFPIETVDKMFQGLNGWLPMTYSIRLIKDCLIATDSNFVLKNCLVLLGIMIAMFAMTCSADFIKKRKNEENNLSENKV